MGEVVVKHFKRTKIGSDDKELVTEIVVQSSDTGRFLKRMEDSRLTRPCFQTIDMRGRVAGECRRYAFNDRVHYLDDISFQMFEQGLQENRGVFTVGTFEAIVGGEHTIQAQTDAREEEDRRRAELEQRRLERARVAALERDGESGDGNAREVTGLTENPDQLPLGYFRRREHPRLQYACSVTLQRGNIRTNAITRDISVCGLRINIKGLTTFKVGQDIQVTFHGGLLTEDDGVEQEYIKYRVVRIEPREAETALCLQRVNMDRPAGFSEVIGNLVEQHQRKYKLDAEDEYRSVQSWLYERSYAQSASQIPFFVEQDENGELRVQAVAMSEGNAHLTHFFCTDADNYNFTPLCLPHRLQQLNEGASYVLAMYRERGDQDECLRIHSAADFESENWQTFQAFAAHALQQPEHCIVKVQVSAVPVVPVPDKKLDEVSQRLQYKSESQMTRLRERLQSMRLVGYIVDVTQAFSQMVEHEGAHHGGQALAWVGTESRRVVDGKAMERLEMTPEALHPELIRFGYVERRREDRYLAETGVEVCIGSKTLQGTSNDISTRGMRIQLDKKVGVKKGATVKIGLVSLQQKKSATNLMDIPYRVIHTRDEEAGTVLMLERVLGGKREGLKEFFVELITKNQHKLGVDIGDIWGATTSRVYEAVLAANTPTIPFFLARSAEGGAHLQFVGIPESVSPLRSFFESDDGPDFRCLNEGRVVSALYDAVQILLRQSRSDSEAPTPYELEMYLYKEVDEVTGETFLHSATELDFATDARREAFQMRLTEYADWRVVKLLSTFSQKLDEKALEKMIDTVRTHSKHRAIKLSDLVHSLVGHGEMIDITAEWALLRQARDSA